MTNSPNRLFIELESKTHYALISGRWYRNTKLDGDGWEYIASELLSSEFRRIPATHPMADVLASIPNTPAARESVLANAVPRTTVISRSQAHLEVDFDGTAPTLEPIAWTSLERVLNAPIPIIRVPGSGYYTLDNGILYCADVPVGPWTAATSVPTKIYAIPNESPLHYVTYARV